MFVSVLIATMGGRTPAFNVGVAGCVLCGFFNLCQSFTVERDEERVQRSIFVVDAESHSEESPTIAEEKDAAAASPLGCHLVTSMTSLV